MGNQRNKLTKSFYLFIFFIHGVHHFYKKRESRKHIVNKIKNNVENKNKSNNRTVVPRKNGLKAYIE